VDERPVFLAADEGTRSQVPGEQFIGKLTGEQTGGRLAFAAAEFAPKHGTQSHRHLKSAEMFYILEGTVIIDVDDESFELGPGGLAYAPAGSRHSLTNIGDTPSRHVAIFAPAGPERAFVAITEMVARAGGVPDIQQILAIAAEYDIVDIGPPRAIS
jgi:quercetin dioxygenase-like cupin family protein